MTEKQPTATLTLQPGALDANEIVVLQTLIETLLHTSIAVRTVSPAVIQAIEDAVASLRPQAVKARQEVIEENTRKALAKNKEREKTDRNVH